MTSSYELTTLQDIFDKVPTDRIQDCCREIGQALAQTEAIGELYSALGAECKGIQFPITWVDDHKGEIDTTVFSRDKDGAEIGAMTLSSRPADDQGEA